eukprot:6204351-Pleurochrysis_carterae.AAC.1
MVIGVLWYAIANDRFENGTSHLSGGSWYQLWAAGYSLFANWLHAIQVRQKVDRLSLVGLKLVSYRDKESCPLASHVEGDYLSTDG